MTELSKLQVPEEALSYDEALKATKDRLLKQLRGAPPLIRPLTAHLAKAGGKMIRAGALLACAQDKSDLINPDAVKAAAAVELLHLSTLVHDDIIDKAEKRRGIEALYLKFGEKSAVLCGDYLFCMALDLVSEIRVLEHRKDSVEKKLPRYMTDICLGELRQNQNLFNYNLTEKEYYKIIQGKTAAMFEASFDAGFMFSDEADEARELYKKLGHTIGVIFQLADDCADYEAAEKDAKKPVLSDFSKGVITLPLIYALKNEPSLIEKIKSGIKPEELKACIEAAGGLSYAHAEINRHERAAKPLLKKLDISPKKREKLNMLLSMAKGV